MTSRPLQEEDWIRTRQLLIDGVPLTEPGFLWEVRRWDGWRYYRPDPGWDPRWERDARAWVAADGSLVAVAHPEGRGDVHVQVLPAHRELEGEMFAWATDRLAVETASGRRLQTPVLEGDLRRQRLLGALNWRKTADWGTVRWFRFGERSPAIPEIAAGYVMRSLRPGELDEAVRLAALLNAAFGRTWHDAPEFLTFERFAPDYDPGLHLVAQAPDGCFAAHVGVTLERTNRLAIVEPVATHPDHRRRGLAEVLIREGLARAREAGATQATVSTGRDEGPNRLYAGVGFVEVHRLWDWEWRG